MASTVRLSFIEKFLYTEQSSYENKNFKKDLQPPRLYLDNKIWFGISFYKLNHSW